jgi:hypothetical protein
MKSILLAGVIAAVAAASPAAAVTNLLANGSFEAAGTTGPGAYSGWTKSGTVGDAFPAIVINYNSTAAYNAGGAFGERVTPDNIVASASPDAVGTRAAYFVGDRSVNETIYQDIFLAPGNYRVGFSYYLTQNGLSNVNNSSLSVSILGINLANTMITSLSTAKTWLYATGIGTIQFAGTYRTALTFNSNGFPSKDVVVDRVFGIATTDGPGILIPPAPDSVVPGIPEPATWALLIVGFGMVGLSARHRNRAVAA